MVRKYNKHYVMELESLLVKIDHWTRSDLTIPRVWNLMSLISNFVYITEWLCVFGELL